MVDDDLVSHSMMISCDCSSSSVVSGGDDQLVCNRWQTPGSLPEPDSANTDDAPVDMPILRLLHFSQIPGERSLQAFERALRLRSPLRHDGAAGVDYRMLTLNDRAY